MATEGQTLGEVFIPVRLKFWENDTIIIHTAKDPGGSGVEMQSAEVQGTEGAEIFAIEDGTLFYDEANKAMTLIAADETDGSRSWTFLQSKALSPVVNINTGLLDSFLNFIGMPINSQLVGNVRAGEKIGTVVDDDLTFFARQEGVSPVVPGANGDILLPTDPITVLDALDVLPLPQDQGKLLTQREAKRLSEQLTGGADLGKIALISGVVVGSGIVIALTVKALSK